MAFVRDTACELETNQDVRFSEALSSAEVNEEEYALLEPSLVSTSSCRGRCNGFGPYVSPLPNDL